MSIKRFTDRPWWSKRKLNLTRVLRDAIQFRITPDPVYLDAGFTFPVDK